MSQSNTQCCSNSDFCNKYLTPTLAPVPSKNKTGRSISDILAKKNPFMQNFASSNLHTKIYMWKLNMYGEYTVTTKHNLLPAYQCIS